MSGYKDLEDRVRQFNALELPGQPRIMHLGTSYLVNDLWREVQRLGTVLVQHEARERYYIASGEAGEAD